jgi:hypothetical protein
MGGIWSQSLHFFSLNLCTNGKSQQYCGETPIIILVNKLFRGVYLPGQLLEKQPEYCWDLHECIMSPKFADVRHGWLAVER